MAKKRDYEADHFNNVEAFTKQIRLLYYAAIREAVRMGLSVNYDPKKPFTFAQFPALNTRVKDLFSSLSGKMLKTINDGSQHEWLLSAVKNDALVQSILPTTKFKPEQLAGYMNRNLEALKEFQTRKSDGMNLSDRIWKQTDQFKSELQLALDVGLLEGKSADQLSRDVRGYLENPDMLFRRVRDARGILHLSKAAEVYKPGQGVYRSSYKNAQRLTRTEINAAYKSSDMARYQQLDFIVGYEVKRSNRRIECKVCESLKGRYPKSFIFRNWHPQCMCYVVSILASKSEISDLTDKILNDEDTSGFKSVNEVTKMPEGWTSWMNENKDRLLRAKSVPYWIKDNFKDGKLAGGLKFALPSPVTGILKRAISLSPTLNSLSDSLAKKLDITVTPVNIKSEKRIIEKANNDYNGDVSRVKDIIRNTFIVKKESQLPEVLLQIQKTFQVVKTKQQSPESDPLGYSGVLMNVLLGDSDYAEIQVNTPQMIYAKEVDAESILGAELFSKIRKHSGLEPGRGHEYSKAYRSLTGTDDASVALRKKLIKESRAYYNQMRKVKI